jgi:hypothetical protein
MPVLIGRVMPCPGWADTMEAAASAAAELWRVICVARRSSLSGISCRFGRRR